MGKLIKGTHHIALKCADTDNFKQTLAFYGDILGLELVRDWGEDNEAGAMFSTGNSLIEIFASGKSSNPDGSIPHFAFAVDDTDACIDAVSKAGYTIKMQPTDIVIGSAIPYPARIGFCIGPVGEEIEFFCEK